MEANDHSNIRAVFLGLTSIKDATRCIFFETGNEDFSYATCGGTAFVVAVDDQPYGITAAHIRRDFSWNGLAITDAKFGNRLAGIDGIHQGKDPQGASVDTDLMDVAVIEFSDDTKFEFFTDPPYRLTAMDVDADAGDILVVHGVPKMGLEIDYDLETITPTFHSIELIAEVVNKYDSTVRTARGQADLNDMSGFSGAPVWNVSKGGLSGMAVRGGINSDGQVTLRFVEISDIRQMLDAIHADQEQVSYSKLTYRSPDP